MKAQNATWGVFQSLLQFKDIDLDHSNLFLFEPTVDNPT